MSVKGKGTIGYIDVDNDDQYVIISCVRSLKPAGMERGVIDGEPCLADTVIEQDTGDLKRGTLTGEMLWDVNEAATHNAMETAINNDSTINFAIKIPKSTPVYVFYTGKLSKLDPLTIERERKIARSFELVLTEAPTYSATAPTLES